MSRIIFDSITSAAAVKLLPHPSAHHKMQQTQQQTSAF